MKLSAKKILVKVFFLVALLGIVVGVFKVTETLEEWGVSRSAYNDIAEAVVKQPKATEQTTSDSDNERVIEVDWEKLQSVDRNACGWLYSEGTEINYPVCLGQDNSYYLKHLIDGTWSSSGTLFIDCRNSMEDDHLYIYGHCMKNDTMFGSLVYYAKQEYYEKHPTMCFVTEDGQYTLRVYSAYFANENDASYVFGSQAEDLESFYDMSSGLSQIETYIPFNNDSKIITLSTCAYLKNYNRFVVHCVMERS